MAHPHARRPRAAPVILSVVFVLGTAGAQQPAEPARVDPPTAELIAALAMADAGAAKAQLELLRRGSVVAVPLAELIDTAWQRGDAGARSGAAAARVLIELGPGAAPAFAQLLACVRNPHSAPEAVWHAAMVLERIGPFAGPRRQELLDLVVEHALRRRNKGVFHQAFFAWSTRIASSLAVDARGADVDALLDLLEEWNPFARVTACRALAARCDELKGHRPRIVAALRELVLEEHDHREWTWFVAGTQHRWPNGDAVVRWLRTEASLALATFEPGDPDAMLGHSQRLFVLDPDQQIDAIRALTRIRDPDCGPWLLDAARQSTAPVAIAALEAIEKIGPTLEHLGPELFAFETVSTGLVHEAAQRVRRGIAPDADRSSPIEPRLEIVGCGIDPTGPIDLEAETARLRRWLDRDSGRNRQLLQADVRHIRTFPARPAGNAGTLSPRMRWVPVRRLPDVRRPGYWQPSAGTGEAPAVLAAPNGAVGPAGERLAQLPWIVELLPADPEGWTFTADDCAVLWMTADASSFTLRIGAARQADFAKQRRALVQRNGTLAVLVDELTIGVRTPGSPLEGLTIALSAGAGDRLPALRWLCGL